MKYQNPIIPGFHPDPSICRVGEDYYIANSSFEFLPGLPVFHSRDLLHWQQIGHCLTRPEQMQFANCCHNGGIFAPTIRYHQGTFYLVTTNVTREGALAPNGSGNFIITAHDAAGPWSDPLWVKQGGIDPSLFWDTDGKVYFTSTMPAEGADGAMINGIYQAEIDPDSGELLTESKIISYGCGGRYAEGPHIYKKDDNYYLLLAEGGTEFGHMVTISRSKSVWGPFEACPHNPILTASQEYDPSQAGIGHADLVEAHDGNWWIVFLCYRLSENYYHHMGRETAIAPMEWVEGWPVVNGGKTPQEEMETDRIPFAHTTAGQEDERDIYGNTSFRTDFSGEDLGMAWNSFRQHFEGYSMVKNPGCLTLMGSQHTLNENATPAFIGRRIDNFEFRAETKLDFEPQEEGEESGLAIAHNPHGHYEFVIAKKNGVKKAVVRKTVFDMVVESESTELPEGPVQLQIIADRYDVIFSIGQGSSYSEIGRGLIKMLSSEVVGGCIGTYIGMYASGNGKPMKTEAKYQWFDYEHLPKKPKRAMFFAE